MKKPILTILIFAFLFTLNSCDKMEPKEKAEPTPKISEEVAPTKLLRHVVLFNFNDKATDSLIKKVEQEFAALPEKISEIHSFEWGTNNSEEKLDKGFTHCFFVTFLSEKDRDAYLPHPDHQAFVKILDGYIEDVTVVDYWTK